MVGKTGTSSGCSTRPCVQPWCAFKGWIICWSFSDNICLQLITIMHLHSHRNCYRHWEVWPAYSTSNDSTERFYVSCQRIEQIVFNVICFCSIWDNRNWSRCDTGYGVYLRWRWRSERSDAGTSLPPKLSAFEAKVNFNIDFGRLQQCFWQVYWCTYKLVRSDQKHATEVISSKIWPLTSRLWDWACTRWEKNRKRKLWRPKQLRSMVTDEHNPIVLCKI